jgi:hypothetical protein
MASSKDSDEIIEFTWAQKRASGRYSIGRNGTEPLQTDLAPKFDNNRSAEEQHPPKNAFEGPFGLSEEALTRLEAGLRAQREQLLGDPPSVPGFCPANNHDDHREPDKLALPAATAIAATRTQDTIQHLPRAAQLPRLLGLAPADNEGQAQTPDTFNSQPEPPHDPERLKFSAGLHPSRRWFVGCILIGTAIATLSVLFFWGEKSPMPEPASVNPDVIQSVPVQALDREVSRAAEARGVLPSATDQLEQVRTPTPQVEPAQSVAIQPAAQPATTAQSTLVLPPSHGDTSPRRSRRDAHSRVLKGQKPN